MKRGHLFLAALDLGYLLLNCLLQGCNLMLICLVGLGKICYLFGILGHQLESLFEISNLSMHLLDVLLELL